MAEWWTIVDGSGRTVARILTGVSQLDRRRLLEVTWVELHARPALLEAGVGGKRMCFPTVRSRSRVTWSKGGEGLGGPDRRLQLDDLGDLRLRLEIRAPLRAGHLAVQLRELSVEEGTEPRLRCRLEIGEFADADDSEASLEEIAGRVYSASGFGDVPPPALFSLGDLVAGHPRGLQRWRLRWHGVHNRWLIAVDYRCEQLGPDRGWWDRRGRPTSPFQPMGLAPLGSPNQEPDLQMDMTGTEPGGTPVMWELRVHWHGSQAGGRTVVSPVEIWNRHIAEPLHCSLHTARARQAASVVPIFEADADDQGHWVLRYQVSDDRPNEDKLRPEHLIAQRPELACAQGDGARILAARLPCFVDHDGCPIERRVKLIEAGFSADEPGTPEFRWRAQVEDHSSWEDLPVQPARVGAVDLLFDGRQPGTMALEASTARKPEAGLLRGGLRLAANLRCHEHGIPVVDARLIWQLAAFEPGGEDSSPTDRVAGARSRPVLVPDPRRPSAITGNFRLYAIERTATGRDHSLTLRLEDAGGSLRRVEVDHVVLDSEPFLVARVRAPIPVGRLGEIANWSGDDPAGAFWEFAETDSFHLILPPQAVGEEALKDYARQTPAQGRRLLDYRFSPPAVAELSRTPFEQAFSEAPWNLRRLLGHPGQRLPGTGLFGLDLELLYGLDARVRTPGLMLAEIVARLGHRAPVPLSSEDRWPGQRPPEVVRRAYDDHRRRSAAWDRILATRLAVLEPWSVAQGGLPRPDLVEGVSFRFRTTRRTADPTRPIGPIGESYWEGGLRGGVDWGFESNNVYREVLGSGPSSSGEIQRLALTALGGCGFQRAGFARDKSQIYSDAFLGRTFFYSLERIGRVGVLWNRAKHVIVYERSVASTHQFPDLAGHWRGRPALRKVREFVEILEPERPFPDGAGDDRRTRFVSASYFPQPILPVTSDWGCDVPGGWKVPLHRPGGNPQVYPEPDVMLALAAPPDAEHEVVWARVTAPERLVFFTSTRPDDTDDTDAWAPVAGIDFPLEDGPVAPTDVPALDPRRPDADLPDAPPIEPGYGRFTLPVDCGGLKVDLLAGRVRQQGPAERSIEACVDSVTLIRRSGRTLPESPFRTSALEARRALAGLGVGVDEAANGVREALFAPKPVLEAARQNLVDTAHRQAAEVVRKVEAAGTPPQGAGDDDLVVGRLERAQAELRILWDGARKDVDAAIEQAVQAEIEALRRRVLSGQKVDSEEIVESLRGLASDLQARVERLIRSAETVLADLESQLLRSAGWFEDACPRLIAELGRTVDDLAAAFLEARASGVADPYVEPALRRLRELDQTLTDLRVGLGPLNPRLLDRVHAGLTEAMPQLLAVGEALTGDEVAARRFVAERLEPAFRPLARELWLACEELRRSVASLPLGGLREEIREELGKLYSIVDDWLTKVKSIGDVSGADVALRELLGGIGGVLDGLGGDDGFFADARRALDAPELRERLRSLFGDPGDGRLADALASRVAEMERRVGHLLAGTDELRDLVRDVDGLHHGVEDLVSSAGTLFDEMTGAVNEVVSDTLQELLTGELPDLEPFQDPGLWLARAYGESPVAESLRLNRRKVAYYLDQLGRRVDLTPVTALFNRAGRELGQLDLKTLGIRLPTRELGERFIPSRLDLKKIDLGSMLPDFAGIRLDDLLRGIGVPEGAGDGVDLTHGIDPRRRRAWAQAVVEVPFERVDLFTLGPVIVWLDEGRFDAVARLEVDAAGGTRRHAKASLTAHWHLTISGADVMVFRDSVLHLDASGRIRFDTSPDRIEVNRALAFITDLLATVQGPEASGLSFELVRAGEIPVGARAVLSLMLPAIQTGAFSMSNLALRGQLEVAAPPSGFYLAAGGALSSKDRPFNLSILCLGGGGWFTALAVYKPFEMKGRRLSGWLSIAISVGASLPFDVGVASGGVYFLVSVGVEGSLADQAGSMTIFLRIAIRGEVVVLGIVSISILVALEARYQSGGSLTCVGILRAKVKLGWMWELKVSTRVTYRLAGSGRSDDGGGARSALLLKASGSIAATPTDPVEAPVDYAIRRYVRSFAD